MSLVIVRPNDCLIAADRRILQGYCYRDDIAKVSHLSDGYYCAVVGHAVLETMTKIWWQEADYEQDPEMLALSLGGFLGTRSGQDVQGTVVLGIPLAGGGASFWEIDHDGTVLPILVDRAVGAPSEAAQVLLKTGASLSTIFALVASSNASISSCFDEFYVGV